MKLMKNINIFLKNNFTNDKIKQKKIKYIF